MKAISKIDLTISNLSTENTKTKKTKKHIEQPKIDNLQSNVLDKLDVFEES